MRRPGNPAFSWSGAVLRHAALAVTSVFVLLPFVWMVSLSLKSPGEIFQATFSVLPDQWHVIENYGTALTAQPLPRFMLNGVIVCAAILVLQILVCAPAAYALAKLRFRGRDVFFALVLVGLLIPHQVLALPLFILAYQIGILDTYAALIFPFIVSPFGIFLFRQFFKAVPDDLVHAARLDGLSETSIVWRVMVPLAWPAVVAFAIFSVVAHWNDLFWPLIAVRSEELMPPPLGVMAFKNEEAGSDYGPLMAGATLIVAPLGIAFLCAQRWFVDGLSLGAVK
ncbi:MAG: carbohydrate ABC transporter permease [Kiloniellales bacterium]|nr:carbohydrate ABC transporter permease [Kiloniellales bacterium]